MSQNKIIICCLTVVFFFVTPITGGQAQSIPDHELQLDFKTKTAIIESVADLIIKSYVLPHIAVRVKECLKRRK